MATTFDMLRANDLIFSYVVSNWLMGQQPPAFDILAWNADSTRLPAAMHSFCLRSLYAKNQLAKGEMELAGQRLSLTDVKNDTYIVGAVNDHIVPWPSSYQATGLLGGTARYVLSSGGHIAGIVNPPGPKAWHEAGEHNPPENRNSGGKPRTGATVHGGRTGRPGPMRGLGGSLSRRRWAATAIPLSARRQAVTSGAEPKSGSPARLPVTAAVS